MFSIFLAVLFSTAFFFERRQRAPSAIVTLLFLACFYAGFQYLAWAMQNLRKSAKSKPAADVLFGQKAITEAKYGLPKYPQILTRSVKFALLL
jgi:hypothetical protein